MGQIQNQFNQALALALGGAMTMESATAGYRELKNATVLEKEAFNNAAYYGGEIRNLNRDLKGITNLEELKDWEDEASVTAEQARLADLAEADAIEKKRQANLKYGDKKQRQLALEQAGDYAQNKYIAELGYGDPAEMAKAKREELTAAAAAKEEAVKQEQTRQEEIKRINTAYEERMNLLKEAEQRRKTSELGADAKMALLKREMEDMKRGK